MTVIPHPSSLHAKIHDPGKRDFADYCARADAKLEFCRLVIEFWPRIAAALGGIAAVSAWGRDSEGAAGDGA